MAVGVAVESEEGEVAVGTGLDGGYRVGVVAGNPLSVHPVADAFRPEGAPLGTLLAVDGISGVPLLVQGVEQILHGPIKIKMQIYANKQILHGPITYQCISKSQTNQILLKIFMQLVS